MLCRQFTESGRQTLVLDILKSPWPCNFQTDDRDLFLDVFWASTDLAVFVDEGGETVGRYEDEMMKTATRGRHNGHQCFYMTQRVTLMNKTLRTQATHIFLFSSAFSDAKLLADDFSCPELEEAAVLPPLSFIYVSTAPRVIKRGRLLFSPDRVIFDRDVSTRQNSDEGENP